MKTFNNTGHISSYDIVHLKGNKDDYTIQENNGIVTFESSSLDCTYTITNVEEAGFKYINELGNKRFPFTDFVSNWTKIIVPGTDLASLAVFGDTSQIASTFYVDATYGIGWGTNDDKRKSFIINSGLSYTEIYIEYSGVYNTPNASLGYLEVSDYNGYNVPWNSRPVYTASLVLNDGSSTASSGQSLRVNGELLYNLHTQDFFNIESTLNTSHKIISMSGYTSGYPYGKRYIKNLWVK